MSNKKRYILLGIIIAGFIGSFLVLYFGYFKARWSTPKSVVNSGTTPATVPLPNAGAPGAPVNSEIGNSGKPNAPAATPAANSSASSSLPGMGAVTMNSDQRILPIGNTLDFTALKAYNNRNIIFNYPTFVPGQNGVNLSELMQTKSIKK